jgi:hypothetical protein
MPRYNAEGELLNIPRADGKMLPCIEDLDGHRYPDRGWPALRAALETLARGDPLGRGAESDVAAAMRLNSVVHSLCVQKPPNNHCAELYRRYTDFFAAVVHGSVLPALQAQETTGQLRAELGWQWLCYAHLALIAAKIFMYLDTYYTPGFCWVNKIKGAEKPKIRDIPVSAFRDAVLPCIASGTRPGVDTAAAARLAQLLINECRRRHTKNPHQQWAVALQRLAFAACFTHLKSMALQEDCDEEAVPTPEPEPALEPAPEAGGGRGDREQQPESEPEQQQRPQDGLAMTPTEIRSDLCDDTPSIGVFVRQPRSLELAVCVRTLAQGWCWRDAQLQAEKEEEEKAEAEHRPDT